MEVITQLMDKYGLSVTLVALMLWYLYKQNNRLNTKIDTMQDKLDAANEKMANMVSDNTKATYDAANAYKELNSTILSRVVK